MGECSTKISAFDSWWAHIIISWTRYYIFNVTIGFVTKVNKLGYKISFLFSLELINHQIWKLETSSSIKHFTNIQIESQKRSWYEYGRKNYQKWTGFIELNKTP